MNISAVLLAGGESRRMGEDKATLCFDGKPLWQIQLDLLRSLQPAEILISARAEPPWRPRDTVFVQDDSPSRGPLSGLAASLRRIQTRHLLALAIDMPFMNEEHLLFLCSQIEPGCGVVPMIGEGAEPLAAIYPIEADVDLAAALAANNFSLQSLTQQLIKSGKVRCIQVTPTEQTFYRNLNEPADFASNSVHASDRSK